MNPAFSTNLLDLLGITFPIVLAPMAGVGTPALAAAVSSAGGLGSIAVGAMSVDKARSSIREVRQRTDKPFNVNVFAHHTAQPDANREAEWLRYLSPHFEQFDAAPPAALQAIYPSFADADAMLELLLAERPPVVSFHFGLPSSDAIDALRAAGITLIANATSVDEVVEIERAGIDAVIAQGIEAGGHRGVFDPDGLDERLSTAALVDTVVSASRLPVLAAGGIMTGADIAGMIRRGAQAAVLGTAFINTPESAVSDAYRAAVSAPLARTVLTRSISGRVARAIENRFTRFDDDPNRPDVPDYPIAYDAGKHLHAAAVAQGNDGYAAHWAGANVRSIRAMPAAALVDTLVGEAAATTAAADASNATREY
ncbi:nitronate monooxygenase [Burkholderia sp. Ac-20353]|uniref:NAD(P)H-dependent flavin oxidoreductase n=1 Tax=Burkholderia sp. Ac-20353 TaxID=2703894 RepID=UPI00197B821A|nr:nitronate monooxygenase [Burkholderia sp. Ac-20353]MBN3785398.1 nitronate monooxygenase [Burkholderia sp. Ac-20353]